LHKYSNRDWHCDSVLIFAAVSFDGIFACDTITAFVAPLVALLLLSAVIWHREQLWNFRIFSFVDFHWYDFHIIDF
jgi:hypothetical protein